jgi:hypothetical protein
MVEKEKGKNLCVCWEEREERVPAYLYMVIFS